MFFGAFLAATVVLAEVIGVLFGNGSKFSLVLKPPNADEYDCTFCWLFWAVARECADCCLSLEMIVSRSLASA